MGAAGLAGAPIARGYIGAFRPRQPLREAASPAFARLP
ncbi:hypothetical protein [Azospirillum argentinense]